jgi:general secretion pathway protein B
MSYILEALKKAQAERQLGNAPTIHAPQPAQAAQPGLGTSRKPLFIGLGAGVLVVVAGALFLWQRAPSPAAPGTGTAIVQAAGQAGGQPTGLAAPPAVLAPSAQGRAAAPAIAASSGAPATTAAAPAAARAPASSTASVASNTLQVSAPPAPPPRPAHVPEEPAHPAAPAAGRTGAGTLASAAPPRAPATAAAPPPAAAAPRAAIAPVAAPAPEDSLPYLHQLPDAIQREVPRVSFGGYMYSANPADRLLLVDKALRHEGEEVAPGLLLEKLLPKAAVMNYRGVRYRVAY